MKAVSVMDSDYADLVQGVQDARGVDFLSLQDPRLGWAEQTSTSAEHIMLLTACLIHYGLDTGLMLRYIGGTTMGEYTDPERALREVKGLISDDD